MRNSKDGEVGMYWFVQGGEFIGWQQWRFRLVLGIRFGSLSWSVEGLERYVNLCMFVFLILSLIVILFFFGYY